MKAKHQQEHPLCAECENARRYTKEWVVCKENCVQHALTDACMDPKWFKPRPENKGELEYGTILPDGTDWRLRKYDTEWCGTKYRIFKNENLFAQFDNRDDADTVMVAMTCECLAPLRVVYEKFSHLDKCLSDPEWCKAGETSAIYGIAGELWRAIKEAMGERK